MVIKNTHSTKRKKSSIVFGIVYIDATFNNTRITFTDSSGNVLAMRTAGSSGFKGAKKSTPHAAQITVESASNNIKSNYDIKMLEIRIQGPGGQKEAAVRAVFACGFVVRHIVDISKIPHNGVRPRKQRRV